MPLLLLVPLAGLLGFGGGFFAADGTKQLIKLVVIAGVTYWVFFTPGGQRILKKVTG